MEYRAITTADQDAAIALWTEVFREQAGYFDRYFAADPWYREGDCFGAWDGGRLVSAVHVCRRPLGWEGETLWCGAIANVATLPDYRRQGLSRTLLRMAIELMERESFAFSMLFTGSFGHYGALGWEQVNTPILTLLISRDDDASVFDTEIQETIRKDYPALTELWRNSPRPLHLERTLAYSTGWSGWEWKRFNLRHFVLPDRGYIAIAQPSDAEALAVIEWAADDAETELRLFRHAASLALAVQRATLRCWNLPVSPPAALSEVGASETGSERHMMLRNVTLEPERYRLLVEAYASGAACWWHPDGF